MKKLLSIITIILAIGVTAGAQTVSDDIGAAQGALTNAVTLLDHDANIIQWAAITDDPAATPSEKLIAAWGEDRSHWARFMKFSFLINDGITTTTWVSCRANLNEILSTHIPAQGMSAEAEATHIRRAQISLGDTYLKTGDAKTRDNLSAIPHFAAAVSTPRPRLDSNNLAQQTWNRSHMLLGRAQWEEGLIQPGMSNLVESVSSFTPGPQMAQKVYDLIRPNRITLQEYKDFLGRMLVILPADDSRYSDLLSAIKAKEEALQ